MLEQIESFYNESSRGVYYLDNQGSGEVFVLLHGISSGAKSWVKQFLTVEAPCRLIAWDAPGYGQSAPLNSTTPAAGDYAVSLKLLTQELGLEQPFTLVGHSLGAMMACAYAQMYSADVKRLVLVNPAQGYALSPESKKAQVYARRPELLKSLGKEGMARERGPYLLAQPTPFNLAVVHAVSMGLTPEGLEQASYSLAYDSIEHYLPHITAEITLCYGDEDGITPPQGMFELQHNYPQLQLEPMAQAGHLAYLDQPELFNRCVFDA